MGLTLDSVEYGKILTAELPRKIESDAEYDRWADRIEAIDFSANASPEERAFADLIGVILKDYDLRTSTDAAPDATLRFLAESNELSQADLARLLGVSTAYSSQIYHGKRSISRKIALQLAERFGVKPELFRR